MTFEQRRKKLKIRKLKGKRNLCRDSDLRNPLQISGKSYKTKASIIFGRRTPLPGSPICGGSACAWRHQGAQQLECSILRHSALACHLSSTSLLKILTALKMQISLG